MTRVMVAVTGVRYTVCVSPMIHDPRISALYEEYALGLAAPKVLPAEGSRDHSERLELLAELKAAGIQGWPERMTLFTRSLPPGCGPCLAGTGSNLAVTGRCTRNCDFCFNPKPRLDSVSVHGLAVEDLAEAPEILAGRGIRSVGISGGEPLLFPERVFELLAALRARFGTELRVDLYTNGDLFTPSLLRRLKDAGLDGLRMNLVANGFNTQPARMALTYFADVAVEIPVHPEPGREARIRALIPELDEAGIPHLILHELFFCAQNQEALSESGFKAKAGESGSRLMWGPVSGSAEAALRLLLFVLKNSRRLSAYYCSCKTQEDIAARALDYAARRPGPARAGA